MNNYIPDQNKIVHETNVDFRSRNVFNTGIHIVQYDNGIPVIAIHLYSNEEVYIIPTNIEAKFKWSRDGINYIVEKDVLGCNPNRTIVYISVDSTMSQLPGTFNPIIELFDNNQNKVGSASMIFIVDNNPVPKEGE